jgi:hypothetical protein
MRTRTQLSHRMPHYSAHAISETAYVSLGPRNLDGSGVVHVIEQFSSQLV